MMKTHIYFWNKTKRFMKGSWLIDSLIELFIFSHPNPITPTIKKYNGWSWEIQVCELIFCWFYGWCVIDLRIYCNISHCLCSYFASQILFHSPHPPHLLSLSLQSLFSLKIISFLSSQPPIPSLLLGWLLVRWVLILEIK